MAVLNDLAQRIDSMDEALKKISLEIDELSKREATVKIPNRLETDVAGLMNDRDNMDLKQQQFKRDVDGLLNNLQKISNGIKQYAHTTKMPDAAGTNTDHDVRYLLKRIFLTWSAGIAGNFDDLEMELPYDFDFDDYFIHYTYNIDLDITDIDIYEDATMANHLFNIHLTYNAAGDLTQKVITRIGDGHTLTRDFAYVSGDLHTIQNTRAP